MTKVMPSVFLGHGNPMNALETNEYTQAWRRFGESVPRPRGILAISAHWYLPSLAVTGSSAPKTIHDFGGFPEELYNITYPAPGSPQLAREVQKLLLPLDVTMDEQRGMDHGTWAVLCHVFPDADIPIVQLSIDSSMNPQFHYETGCRLQSLRDEGILIVGSGNLVHNLHAYAWGRDKMPPYDWAVRFEETARNLITEGKDSSLVDYQRLGDDALLSVPTPDHYLPLLYILGLRREHETVSFPVEGFEGGSLSMLSVQIG